MIALIASITWKLHLYTNEMRVVYVYIRVESNKNSFWYLVVY